MSVLLADDDQDDRTIITEILEQAGSGYRVSALENGEQVMAWLRSSLRLPDLILLDDNMPRKSGHECAREIRQDPRLCRIPLIILSVSDSEKDTHLALKSGATAFLTKANTLGGLKIQVEEAVKLAVADAAGTKVDPMPGVSSYAPGEVTILHNQTVN